METLRARFIEGAGEKSGVPPETAARIWELMAAFAGYGFPKAHAASYAVVAWRAAWCKAHHPALFMAAVLANWGGYYSQRVYLMEARRMGLRVRPPHVSASQPEFSVHYQDGEPVLIMGLDQVRDLTRATQARILQGRPFQTFEDFLARVDPRPLEVQNLVKVGALAGFGSIPALLARSSRGGWQRGQLALFAMDGMEGSQDGDEDWTEAQRVAAQEQILGIGVDRHPLELLAEALPGTLTTVQAAARVGQSVRVVGLRQGWRRHESGGQLLLLEDPVGMLPVYVNPAYLKQVRRESSGPGPFLVEGVVEIEAESGEPFIRAEKISRTG
jgi:DNA polymerase III alpha subunit